LRLRGGGKKGKKEREEGTLGKTRRKESRLLFNTISFGAERKERGGEGEKGNREKKKTGNRGSHFLNAPFRRGKELKRGRKEKREARPWKERGGKEEGGFILIRRALLVSSAVIRRGGGKRKKEKGKGREGLKKEEGRGET